MFDGMPDQFYQFLVSTKNNNNNTITTSLTQTVPPLPLSFQQQQQQPIFDAAYLFHYQQQQQQQQQHCTRNEAKGCILAQEADVPWSNEEVLALLKIRSCLETNPWFPPEFIWDNVSRKLEEVGFKRSAQNCKDKFEEETRSFNTNNIVINSSHKGDVISQNYRLFGELEELYNCNDDHEDDTNNHQMDDHSGDTRSMSLCMKNQIHDSTRNGNEGEVREIVGHEMGQVNSEGSDETGERGRDNDIEVDIDNEKLEESSKEVVGRKRKRHKKFEMFKGFYEKIVNNMIEQQEEFHCKVIEDMVKRDEEKIAREEAWKKHEIDVITKELEVRAHEQAIVGDRQAKLLGFLSKFSSLSSTNLVQNAFINDKVPKNASLVSTSSSLLSQDCVSATTTTTTTTTTHGQSPMSNLVTQQKCNLPTSLSNENLGPQNPNPIPSNQYDVPTCKAVEFEDTSIDAPRVFMDFKSPKNHTPSASTMLESVKDDTGRRWPRDEVLALINIRCSLFNNNNNNNGGDNHEKESFSKFPLWERVSHKMLELGYKRSSKRCKEKWENINKYFRKTKDLNKKRSIDSRTCPYFQQLSHLYNNQGIPHDHSDRHENILESPPENQSRGGRGGSSTSNNGATTTTCTMHGNEGSVVQMSAEFGFEF